MRLLLAEDEPALARLVSARLRQAGFEVDHADRVADLVDMVDMAPYELLILDRRLPDGDAIRSVPALRRKRPGIRIMMLTALDAVGELVSGLDAGADDYMTKPFEMDELLARVRAGLRRPGAQPLPPITCGRLVFDPTARSASVGDEPIVMHRRELAIIEALMQRNGRVVQRNALLDHVYGFETDVQPNALDAQISRLRRRLQALGAGVAIHTVRGVGYMLKTD